MKKTLDQIAKEQEIYLNESLSEKTHGQVTDEFVELCKKLNIEPSDKVKSMSEHFNNFINAQIAGKQEVTTCQHCINAKGKIRELEWNKEV